jgi:hypothetical protein
MERVIALYCVDERQYKIKTIARQKGRMSTNHSLVNRRPNPVIILAMHNHLSNFKSREIRQTKLHELPLLVQLVELLQRLLERHAPVRGVQVEDIDTIRAELFERLVQFLFDDVRLVGAGSVRVPFRGTSQSALFPLRFAGEGFLLAADVDSGGVDLVVAGALEAVEDLVVVVDVGDAGAFGLVGTESHGPEDDAWLAGAGDERHVVCDRCGERPEWRGCQWVRKRGTGEERLREELLEHKYLQEMELAGLVFPFYSE